MGRPHSHESEGQSGIHSYVLGVGPRYWLLPRPGIPFLNLQVVVEDMFLELF